MGNEKVLYDLMRRQQVLNAIRTKAQNNKQKVIEEKRANAGFLEKAGATLGDFFGNVITGAVKGIEGIIDAGESLVGAIGGIFDKDFQKRIQQNIAYDWTGNNVQKPLDEIMSASYLNNWGEVGSFIKNVGNGVGQMLPNVALSFVPGANLGMTALTISAAGNSMEEAFQNPDTNYYRGMLYGVASGAVEAGTEMLGDKLFGANIYGKQLGIKTDKTLFAPATTKWGKLAQTFIGEGLEESVSEIANPLTKTIYQGSESLKDYGSLDYWKSVGQAGLVGGTTALAYGGTVGNVVNKMTHGDIRDSIENLNNLEKSQKALQIENKLTPEKKEQITKFRTENINNISEGLSKINPDKRANVIKKLGLEKRFDNNGSFIEQTQTEGNKALASRINANYYTPELENKLIDIETKLNKRGSEVYKGQLTEQEENKWRNIKRNHKALSDKGVMGTNIVLVEQMGKSWSYLDENTIIVGKDVLEGDNGNGKLIHEIEHFSEGSKEWADYGNYILKEMDTTEMQNFVARNYTREGLITQEDLNTIQENLKSGKLTEGQKTFINEVIAHQTEALFGSEEMINKLTRENRTLAQKLWNRIKDIIEVFKASTPEEREEIKKLQKAARLFEKALNNAGKGYIAEEMAKAVDQKNQNQYNEEKQPQHSLKDSEVEDGRRETNTYSAEQNGSGQLDYRQQRSIWDGNTGPLVSTDTKGIRDLQEIKGQGQEFAKIIDKIVDKSKLSSIDEERLLLETKKIGLKTYFYKSESNLYYHDFKTSILILPDTITTQQAGVILDEIAPYKQDNTIQKIAHISKERWNSFLEENPDCYVATVKTADFLDMTADKLAQRTIFNETENLNIDELKNIGYTLYLKVDFKKGKVVDHEGKHRVTALQKAGYTDIDVFIKPVGNVTEEVISRINLNGQKSSDSNETNRKTTIKNLIKQIVIHINYLLS